MWFFFRHIKCDHWLKASALIPFVTVRSLSTLTESGNRMDLDAAMAQVHTHKQTHIHTVYTGADNGHSITNAFYMNGPVIVLLVMHSLNFIPCARIGFHPNDFDHADH